MKLPSATLNLIVIFAEPSALLYMMTGAEASRVSLPALGRIDSP